MHFAALNAPYGTGRLDGANFAAKFNSAGMKPPPTAPLSLFAFPRPPPRANRPP